MSQDKGHLGEDGLPDKGTPPDATGQYKPSTMPTSLDMFGNPILPAKADSERVAGGDRGNALQSSSQSQSQSQSKPIVMIPQGKGGMGKAGIIAAVVALLGVSFYGIGKLVTHSTKSPNEIFKMCSPSLVTLHIMTKSMALKVNLRGAELTDLKGEDPIMLMPDDDGNLRLFQDGKATNLALGILKIPQGKLPVAIKMSGSTPIIFAIDKSGKSAARLKMPMSIERYTMTAIGSGFFVKPDIVATNWHVVSGPSIGTAGFAGGLAQITDQPAKYSITDKPIAFDKDHDLALLYVPGTGAHPLVMHTDYGSLKVGQPVYALGSPKGLAGSLSEGLISSDQLRGVNPTDPDSPKLYLQHSAKIDHGNSGGPLVDAGGEVVGINTAGIGNGAINLAVVSSFVKDLLDKPETKAKIEEFIKKQGTDLHG